MQVGSTGNKIILFDEQGKKMDEHFIERDKLEPDLEIDAERFLIQLVAQLTQAAPQLPGGWQPAQHYPAPLPDVTKRAYAQPSSASTAASALQGEGLNGLADSEVPEQASSVAAAGATTVPGAPPARSAPIPGKASDTGDDAVQQPGSAEGPWCKLSVVQLKVELRARSLPVGGRKAVLVSRLAEAEAPQANVITNYFAILRKGDDDDHDADANTDADADTDSDTDTDADSVETQELCRRAFIEASAVPERLHGGDVDVAQWSDQPPTPARPASAGDRDGSGFALPAASAPGTPLLGDSSDDTDVEADADTNVGYRKCTEHYRDVSPSSSWVSTWALSARPESVDSEGKKDATCSPLDDAAGDDGEATQPFSHDGGGNPVARPSPDAGDGGAPVQPVFDDEDAEGYVPETPEATQWFSTPRRIDDGHSLRFSSSMYASDDDDETETFIHETELAFPECGPAAAISEGHEVAEAENGQVGQPDASMSGGVLLTTPARAARIACLEAANDELRRGLQARAKAVEALRARVTGERVRSTGVTAIPRLAPTAVSAPATPDTRMQRALVAAFARRKSLVGVSRIPTPAKSRLRSPSGRSTHGAGGPRGGATGSRIARPRSTRTAPPESPDLLREESESDGFVNYLLMARNRIDK